MPKIQRYREMKTLNSGVLFSFMLMTGMVMADELKIEGGGRVLIEGEVLETLWEEGGFTEGASAGPDGNMYFSDFSPNFSSFQRYFNCFLTILKKNDEFQNCHIIGL